MRVTASARFQMARRYLLRERLTLYSISAASLGIVFIGMLRYFGVHVALPAEIVDLGIICLSLSVLVLTLLEAGGGYGKRSERAHAGALEINITATRYQQALDNEDTARMAELYDHYADVLRAHENHAPVDYRFAQIDRPDGKTKPSRLQKIILWVELRAREFVYLSPAVGLGVLLLFLMDGACVRC